MFTGIISHLAKVVDLLPTHAGKRLTLVDVFSAGQQHAGEETKKPRLGDSIAVNGVCLTVAALDAAQGTIGFDVIPQTLGLSNLGLLRNGDVVNLERAVRVGDRLDGHMVQGHVDGVADLLWHRSGEKVGADGGGEWRTRLKVPGHLAKYLIPQGSVCLDGISLTLAKVEGDELEVALIPTTLELTTLGKKKPGAKVNVEVDAQVKTITAVLERMNLVRGSAGV